MTSIDTNPKLEEQLLSASQSLTLKDIDYEQHYKQHYETEIQAIYLVVLFF